MSSTNKTNLQIIEFINKLRSPITITELSRRMKKNYQSVKNSIGFLEKLGIIATVSNGKITLIQPNKNLKGNKNAKTY